MAANEDIRETTDKGAEDSPAQHTEGSDEARRPEDRPDTDAQDRADPRAENRRKMGVGDDHKTRDMEKKHRGTFP